MNFEVDVDNVILTLESILETIQVDGSDEEQTDTYKIASKMLEVLLYSSLIGNKVLLSEGEIGFLRDNC